VGDALQRARAAAIARGEQASVWGAFTVIGDAMVRPALERRPARWLPGVVIGGALLALALAAIGRQRRAHAA
jgi:hypothetical protein